MEFSILGNEYIRISLYKVGDITPIKIDKFKPGIYCIVICFVNNNVVDKYWIKCGNEISINGYTLDWRLINNLLLDDETISKSNWERNLKYG